MFIVSNQLINIRGWNVWDTKIESNYITFILKYLDEIAVCPFCGSKHIHLHKVRKVSVRDLQILDKRTTLELEKHQYYCNECYKYFTPSSNEIDFRREMTERYKIKVFEKIKNSTITHVANEEGLTYDQVKGILESKFEKKNDESYNKKSV